MQVGVGEGGGGGMLIEGESNILTLAYPFRIVPSRIYFPRPAKAGGEGEDRGGGKGDVGVIYEHSLTPPQEFRPILTFSVPFIASSISENNTYLVD